MDVSAPQFLIGAKLPPAPAGEEALRQRLVSSLALRLLVGASSDFYNRLYASGLLNRDFDAEVDFSAGTGTLLIGGESPDPEAVLRELTEELRRVGREGLDPAASSGPSGPPWAPVSGVWRILRACASPWRRACSRAAAPWTPPSCCRASRRRSARTSCAGSCGPEQLALSIIEPRRT